MLKSWGHTDNGVVTGVVRNDGPKLDGLEVGRRYKFFCKEERGEFGVETTKNILTRYKPLNPRQIPHDVTKSE